MWRVAGTSPRVLSIPLFVLSRILHVSARFDGFAFNVVVAAAAAAASSDPAFSPLFPSRDAFPLARE